MDPNNTTTNPLGSTPLGADPAVDETVGMVGTTIPQVPVEPIVEEPIVPVAEEPTVNPYVSGKPTVPEPTVADTMSGIAEPTVGVDEPAVEEPVTSGIAEPTVGVADTTGLGGVTNPTV